MTMITHFLRPAAQEYSLTIVDANAARADDFQIIVSSSR